MKWYKHLTASLDDPDIFEAIDRFGGDGYLVFFGTLELMAREFDVDNPGVVQLPMRFLTKKLQLSRQKTVKILTFFAEKTVEKHSKVPRFSFVIKGKYITLNCPKLKDLCDEWTKKQLRSDSGVSQDSLPPIEGEVEEEKSSSGGEPLKDKYPEYYSDLVKSPHFRSITVEQYHRIAETYPKADRMTVVARVLLKADIKREGIHTPTAFLEYWFSQIEKETVQGGDATSTRAGNGARRPRTFYQVQKQLEVVKETWDSKKHNSEWVKSKEGKQLKAKMIKLKATIRDWEDK